MIEFKNVSKVYQNGTEALKKLNLVIDDGEFVFITGHSGAGKSSMIKCLYCEEFPTSGKVLINGKNTKQISRRNIPRFRQQIGIVFQDFRLIDNMTVYDNIAFAMRVVGKPRKEIDKRVKSVLELVGLTDKVKEYPLTLSGGEQQRVAIARAIVNGPDIIIADEPTGNIDPDRSREIMNLLKTINDRGITVVVVTHETTFIEEFNKRTVVIENGTVVSDSANPEIGGRPETTKTEPEPHIEPDNEHDVSTQKEQPAEEPGHGEVIVGKRFHNKANNVEDALSMFDDDEEESSSEEIKEDFDSIKQKLDQEIKTELEGEDPEPEENPDDDEKPREPEKPSAETTRKEEVTGNES